MLHVLFICHGNICRSTMAESVFTHVVKKRGWEGKIEISSAATHSDAIGCSPHRGTREKLGRENIPLVPHRARLLTKSDAEKYDFIIGMDEENLFDMRTILGREYENKITLLLDYTSQPRAIADPWYTGNFDETFCDILEGCEAFANYLEEHGHI